MRRAADSPPPRADGGPVRTCVGCRRTASPTALFRVVAVTPPGPDVPVRLVVDTRRRLPGRGAWVHPDPRCVEQAIRRRAFTRALRLTGNLDVSGVTDGLTAAGPPGPGVVSGVDAPPGTPAQQSTSPTAREQVHER